MRIIDRIEQWSTLAAEWADGARRAGRSPAPRARHLRNRSRDLAAALAELRKRHAEAEALATRIDALVIEETAADAVIETAEGRAA